MIKTDEKLNSNDDKKTLNSPVIKAFEDWLNSFLNFEKFPKKNMFWLDTMEYFSKKSGDANLFCPSFHIAGSKGKGSTSAFIAAILEEQGLKTGLYTSPHILSFLERVTENQKLFSKEVYEDSAKELISLVESPDSLNFLKDRPITWFELITLYSFLCFRRAKVDCGVFEVGLGGRLDATNVIKPKVCCIGPIELEHTEYLGNTLEKIAEEKGGIIKENTPVVIAFQPKSVKEVFKKIAEEKHAPIYFIDEICPKITAHIRLEDTQNRTSLDKIAPSLKMETVIDSKIFLRPIKANLNLLGDFQAENAALASIAVKLAFPQITEETIEKGLSKAKLPARFEIVDTQKTIKDLPYLILDGAHTPRSVGFTLNTLKEAGLDVKTLLFACAEDKKSDEIAELFKDFNAKIFLTVPGNVKKSDLSKVEKSFAQSGIKYIADTDYLSQIKNAIEESKKTKAPLLVTGSFYLVSEVKKYLQAIEKPL